MKTLVIYYSYSGHTKAIAEKIAADETADIVEIKDAKRPGKLKAYSMGCFAAIKGRAWPIVSLIVDLALYERIILLSPIWAGNVPPAINTFLELLPESKIVSVKLISGSGKSACLTRIESIIIAKAGSVEGIEDIKA